MDTYVIMDPEAPSVADNKVMAFARANKGTTTCISSGLVLDAFRLLMVLDEIQQLTVRYTDGSIAHIDRFGVADVPYKNDEVLDVHMQIVSNLIKGGLEKRIAEKKNDQYIPNCS